MDLQSIAKRILNQPANIGRMASETLLYDPKTKEPLPMSPLHSYATMIQAKPGSPERQQAMTDFGTNFMMGGMTKYIPDSEAKLIPQYAQKLSQQGNLGIDDYDKVLQIARNRLKIPKKTFSQMSIEELLAELGGLLDKNQSYAFDQLPKQNIAKQAPSVPQRTTSILRKLNF